MEEIKCRINIHGNVREYVPETTYKQLAKEYQKQFPDDIVLVLVNNRLRELREKVESGNLTFITTADKDGRKAYRRSTALLMQKAVHNLYGEEKITVRIMHSIAQGYYCELKRNEEKNGTYIFNSRDLCMIEHIPELVNAGVDSFKIEGRAKSEYYTAIVTYAYRNAIDEYLKNPSDDFKPSKWILDEMEKMSHREYTTGFNFGPIENGQVIDTGGYIRNWDVCALFKDYSNGRLTVSQRNRFFEGDMLEVVEPNKKPYIITVEDLYNLDDDEKVDVANKATDTYSFKCDIPVSQDAIFRRQRTE